MRRVNRVFRRTGAKTVKVSRARDETREVGTDGDCCVGEEEGGKTTVKRKLVGDGGEENGGRRGRKGPAGRAKDKGRRLACLLLVGWVQCRSTSGQCPVTTSVSPAKTGGLWAGLALFDSVRLAAR